MREAVAGGPSPVLLYFAKPRPVVRREDICIVVDDPRMQREPGEVPEQRMVRFRALGCYLLTAATDSDAADLDAIVVELAESKLSERGFRLIDRESDAAMERRKREGYF